MRRGGDDAGVESVEAGRHLYHGPFDPVPSSLKAMYLVPANPLPARHPALARIPGAVKTL